MLYRGVRLKDHQVDEIKIDGMSYYWQDPEQAVTEVLRALEVNNKISKLGKEPLLRSMLQEASRIGRVQLWATDDKNNANSYSRASPELIYLTLDYAGLTKQENYNYLNKRFGNPYVVTFEVEPELRYNGINTPIGSFIPPSRIIDVEEVDLNSPDPLFAKFKVTA